MLMVPSSKKEESSSMKLFLDLTTSKENSALIFNDSTSLLETPAGSGYDTCSFYSGPSDATIFSFGESLESGSSLAFSDSGEPCGSIAFSSSGESCGSIASSSGSSFSGGGGCSYSC